MYIVEYMRMPYVKRCILWMHCREKVHMSDNQFITACLWFNLCLNELLRQEYQNIVDAEWDILYDKLDKIVQSGAKVVLSKLPIGDVATQYFADR